MILRIIITIVMCFSFFSLFGQTSMFKTVEVEEFAKAVSDTSYVVLDVRTSAEHAEGHIPGTHLNIDVLGSSYTETVLRVLPKDKPVAASWQRTDIRYWSLELDSEAGLQQERKLRRIKDSRTIQEPILDTHAKL